MPNILQFTHPGNPAQLAGWAEPSDGYKTYSTQKYPLQYSNIYVVAGRGDSEGISLSNLRWKTPGRFHCNVLPLDLRFPKQTIVR